MSIWTTVQNVIPQDGKLISGLKKLKKGVPMKVLQYFPIIPRFRRMLKSLEMTEQLTWYTSHESQDGKMRHSVDSPTWSTIDKKWT